MRRVQNGWLAGGVLAALGALVLAGCFSPAKPKCQFQCGSAADKQCPTDYECRADQYCHKKSAPAGETCDFPPNIDASVAADAAPPDASPPDAAAPDAAVVDAQVIDVLVPDAEPFQDADLTDAPECSTSAQCTTATEPICVSLSCDPCSNAGQCTAKNAAFKACLGSGACAECDDDTDCGAAAPRCNTTTNTCVACTSDVSCSFRATTPVCAEDGSGACIAATGSTFAGCSSYIDGTAGGRTITFDNGNTTYLPNCLRISMGQSVTWMGDFTMHPLRSAPGNPGVGVIASTDTGASQSFTFNTTGFYGYYCNIHGSAAGTGMSGTIQVVP